MPAAPPHRHPPHCLLQVPKTAAQSDTNSSQPNLGARVGARFRCNLGARVGARSLPLQVSNRRAQRGANGLRAQSWSGNWGWIPGPAVGIVGRHDHQASSGAATTPDARKDAADHWLPSGGVGLSPRRHRRPPTRVLHSARGSTALAVRSPTPPNRRPRRHRSRRCPHHHREPNTRRSLCGRGSRHRGARCRISLASPARRRTRVAGFREPLGVLATRRSWPPRRA